MLQTKTAVMIEKIDGIMEDYKNMIGFESIMDMDTKTFELLQKSMNLYKYSKSLAMEQAKLIDSLDRKTDELLEINKILLTKLEESKGV